MAHIDSGSPTAEIADWSKLRPVRTINAYPSHSVGALIRIAEDRFVSSGVGATVWDGEWNRIKQHGGASSGLLALDGERFTMLGSQGVYDRNGERVGATKQLPSNSDGGGGATNAPGGHFPGFTMPIPGGHAMLARSGFSIFDSDGNRIPVAKPAGRGSIYGNGLRSLVVVSDRKLATLGLDGRIIIWEAPIKEDGAASTYASASAAAPPPATSSTKSEAVNADDNRAELHAQAVPEDVRQWLSPDGEKLTLRGLSPAQYGRVSQVLPHLMITEVVVETVGDFGLAQLLNGLRENGSVTSLTIRDTEKGSRISDYGAEQLAGYVGSNNRLRRLEMRGTEVTARGMTALAGGLASNETLVELDLSQNNGLFCQEAVEALAAGLRDNSTLTSLTIDRDTVRGMVEGARLDDESAMPLFALANLTSLSLKYHSLRGEGGWLGVLRGNKTLKCLDLVGSPFSEKGLLELAETLKLNDTLLDLKIGSVELPDRWGWSTLIGLRFAEALEVNRRLESLAIGGVVVGGDTDRGNHFGEASASKLGQVLRKHPSLTNLVLRGLGITDDELKQLLQPGGRLERLDLRDNAIGNEGAKAAAAYLEGNTTLELLSIYNNRVGADGLNALSRALAANRTLTTLGLVGNELAGEGLVELVQLTRKNHTLLDLSFPAPNLSLGLSGDEAEKGDLIETFLQRNRLLARVAAQVASGDSEAALETLQEMGVAAAQM